jgi:hypothetical protein
MLPGWPISAKGRFKKGRQWKHRVDLRAFRSRRASARVETLVFPEVTRHRDTALRPLSPSKALAACLGQRPKEYPASTLGPLALQAQFDIYADLVAAAASYRLMLGSDTDRLRQTLARL